MNAGEPRHAAKVKAFFQYFLSVIGVGANILGVASFAYEHFSGGVILVTTGVLAGSALFVFFRQEVLDFMRRRRRDIGFAFLGAAVGTGMLALRPEVRPPPPPCPELKCPETKPPLACPEIKSPAEEPPSSPTEFVYRTPTGRKYHREACRYVRGNPNASRVTLVQAKEAGLTPCLVCNPPP